MNENSHVIGAAPSTAIVPSKPSSIAEFTRSLRKQAPDSVKDGTGAIVGAAAGAYLYKRNRPLGAIAGAVVGYNAPKLMHAGERREALCNMGVVGAGILASRAIPRHKWLALGAGWLGASILVQTMKLRGV